jgi:hypothetical protein
VCYGKSGPVRGSVTPLPVPIYRGLRPINLQLTRALKTAIPLRDRHPGWLKIGLPIRIAQDLRLMMEPGPTMSYIDQEERRRVFWSIYILDKLCSCGRGRPAALADAQCLIRLPCDEESFRNGQWKDTSTLAQVFSSREASTEASTERPSPFAMVVLTASVLGRCAQHSIHESTRGNGHLPPWDSKSEHATIHTVLLRLEALFDMGHNIGHILQQDCMRDGQLDTQPAGPIVFSHALFRTCQCLLHHPFLLNQHARLRGIKAPPSYWNQAMHTCRENAEALSRLLQEIKIEGYSAFFSFMGYCATVSGSVHSLYLDHEDAKLRQQASDCFQNDLQYLEEFSAYWKHGIWMVYLQSKLKPFLDKLMKITGHHNGESCSTICQFQDIAERISSVAKFRPGSS